MTAPLPLISTIVAAFVIAFVLGALAHRLRIPPLVGYLLAGVIVGPHTPGFVADQALAMELADIGIILLMFGVGLQFSLDDLLSVKAVAVPGALGQMAAAGLLGCGLGWAMGWSAGAVLVFGLALSVASTVMVLRGLQERRLLESERGRIAVGWLIVQDLAMVFALVLLPVAVGLLDVAPVADGGTPGPGRDAVAAVSIAFGKIAAFAGLMLLIGRRVIPHLLHWVAHTGSRELFRLAVLVIALGVAYGSAGFFDVSLALGAFLAGMMLNESELSQRAAAETLPLRDAFAVLFFISVGMLADPAVLVDDPWPAIATMLVILVGNGVVAMLILLAFRHPLETALTIGASLAQIGEFSFILAGLGVSLGVLPAKAYDLILAGAILSILANPLLFAALNWWTSRADRRREAQDAPAAAARPVAPATALAGHAVVVGWGRVGSLLGEGLLSDGWRLFVIEERDDLVEQLRTRSIEAVLGNGADPAILAAASIPAARCLFIAVPDGFEAGQIAEQSRRLNPTLEIVARAHSDAEVEHLRRYGATLTIMGEREIARCMLDHARSAHAGR